MPLSKKRNRDRMRESRLHNKDVLDPVQPSIVSLGVAWRQAHPEQDSYGHPLEIDADGNPVYED